MSLTIMNEAVHPPVSPDIAKAIVAVMAQIGTLGKDSRNDHASYKYVSVDKFFDSIGRLMAKEGIFVLTNEVSTSVDRVESVDKRGEVKIGSWLTANYELFLCHSNGSVCGPVKRVIRVQATGPQAYGAAASYVEKYFLRSLFKIPTGDHDIDGEPQDGLPAQSRAPTPPAPPSHLGVAQSAPVTGSSPVSQATGKRILPKTWREDVRALFKAAESLDKLNAAYDKSVAAYRFEGDNLDELDALIREAADHFKETA